MMRWLGLFLFFAASAWADSVGNGGGLSEQNFSYAYLNLSVAYNACLESPACLSDPESRRLLLNLKAALPEEYRNRNQLQFKSGKENPGLFQVAGSERHRSRREDASLARRKRVARRRERESRSVKAGLSKSFRPRIRGLLLEGHRLCALSSRAGTPSSFPGLESD